MREKVPRRLAETKPEGDVDDMGDKNDLSNLGFFPEWGKEDA
jgi:hypothetical protein